MQLIKAAPGRITTQHGTDIGRGFNHVGIDIGNGMMTAADLRMVAPAKGIVSAAGWSGTYGNRVIIIHDDGSWSLLAHMADKSLRVKAGDIVKQGQQVGVMGRTGGPWGDAGWYVHGHQEYHLKDGTAVDPLAYISTTAGGNKKPVPIKEEDPMPEYQSKDYSGKPITWPVGKFVHLPVTTDAATYDIARGPEVGTVDVDVKLAGLAAGQEAQLRIAIYEGGKHKKSLGVVEIIGTSGGTFGQHSRQYKIGKGQSIRAELAVFAKGVTVERISHTKVFWR